MIQRWSEMKFAIKRLFTDDLPAYTLSAFNILTKHTA